jgi:UDPglucose 6-dehydrogenase
MVHKNFENGSLRFTTEIKEAMAHANICFIAVGTPMDDDGSADLHYVVGAARSIGQCMTAETLIIDKSTVPVGTADMVRAAVAEELEKRGSTLKFDVASNPEFLKEGTAVTDFMRPDRVVIGVSSDHARDMLTELYKPFVRNNELILTMDIKSAEMTKYAANCMLATKISFINEIANVCERVGADVNKVRLGIGSDKRIGYSFIYPGCGYGGSCFPKDVKALIKTAEEYGYNTKILHSVVDVNESQKMVIPAKITSVFGSDLSGKTFALWGLAFKPGTDDMREASALTLIADLTARGAKIKAYDPKAMEAAQDFWLKGNENVEYVSRKYQALDGADALVILTEWEEFRSPDFEEIKAVLKNPVIFDGRNLYDFDSLKEKGIDYYQIGVRKEVRA